MEKEMIDKRTGFVVVCFAGDEGVTDVVGNSVFMFQNEAESFAASLTPFAPTDYHVVRVETVSVIRVETEKKVTVLT